MAGLDDIGERLVRGVLELEVMKILWSRPASKEKVRRQIKKSLKIGVNKKVADQIMDLMERNGYIESSVSRKSLRQTYSLTLAGESLFEQTWQSIKLMANLNNDRLVRWISLYLASRDVHVDKQLIENSLKDYQAEGKLRECLART